MAINLGNKIARVTEGVKKWKLANEQRFTTVLNQIKTKSNDANYTEESLIHTLVELNNNIFPVVEDITDDTISSMCNVYIDGVEFSMLSKVSITFSTQEGSNKEESLEMENLEHNNSQEAPENLTNTTVEQKSAGNSKQ